MFLNYFHVMVDRVILFSHRVKGKYFSLPELTWLPQTPPVLLRVSGSQYLSTPATLAHTLKKLLNLGNS